MEHAHDPRERFARDDMLVRSRSLGGRYKMSNTLFASAWTNPA
jgi:hypothetical protein